MGNSDLQDALMPAGFDQKGKNFGIQRDSSVATCHPNFREIKDVFQKSYHIYISDDI